MSLVREALRMGDPSANLTGECKRRSEEWPSWNPCGVQTAPFALAASIWRPNRVKPSLLFSVTMVCK